MGSLGNLGSIKLQSACVHMHLCDSETLVIHFCSLHYIVTSQCTQRPLVVLLWMTSLHIWVVAFLHCALGTCVEAFLHGDWLMALVSMAHVIMVWYYTALTHSSSSYQSQYSVLCNVSCASYLSLCNLYMYTIVMDLQCGHYPPANHHAIHL